MRVLTILMVAGALIGCAAVNDPDPMSLQQQFRADMAGFCLRNPTAIGCEKFSKGVQR